MDTILVFCAHPDDEVFGVGGTIAKYTSQGSKVITVIFSYGEKAMPLMKESESREIRKKECIEAAEIIGSKTIFLGLKEGKIDTASPEVIEKIKNIVRENSPEKIFTHSIDDPHIDHKAVHNLVVKVLKVICYKKDLYAFDVWNPITLRKRNAPKLYVDVTDTFKTKLKALRKFRSQKVQGRWPLMPAVYFRAVFYGFQNKCMYAERFLKINLSE